MKHIGIAAAVLLLVPVVASAAPAGASGTFSIQFPKGHAASNAPCPAGEFCGVGTLTGYGPATITILHETFDAIDESDCFAVTRTEEIDLLSDAGALVVNSTGTFCRPGGSGGSNASSSSYGGPGRFVFSYAIDPGASTGVFSGKAGAGTETMDVNGGIGVWHLAAA